MFAYVDDKFQTKLKNAAPHHMERTKQNKTLTHTLKTGAAYYYAILRRMLASFLANRQTAPPKKKNLKKVFPLGR